MRKLSAALLLGGMMLALSLSSYAKDKDKRDGDDKIKHVLLISVDGMHAVDFKNCAKGVSGVNNGEPFCPAMAALAKNGINYVAASTSKPSDSFPGLTAIITGGSPALTGVYYDVAYARNLDGPVTLTGNGNPPGPCSSSGAFVFSDGSGGNSQTA